LIVHQVPQIPDRSDAIMQGSDAPLAPMLVGLERLAAAGAHFAVIPCNTAHCWHDRLTRMQSLAILHIADAVRQELELDEAARGRVAVLATRGTQRAGVYRGRLGKTFEPTLPVVEPVQILIDRAVAAVKAREYEPAAAAAREAARRLLDAGADTLILACTELPIALAESVLRERCIDSTLALARACVAEARRDCGKKCSE
jgi:aspartate racemase